MRSILLRMLSFTLMLALILGGTPLILTGNADTEQSENELNAFIDAEPLAVSGYNDYINNGVAMKIGSEYMLYLGEQKAILTSDDGKMYGAPAKVGEVVYLPLDPIVTYVGGEYLIRPNGVTLEISLSDTVITLDMLSTAAAARGELLELSAPPIYRADEKSEQIYPCIALSDVEMLFPGNYITYDDMGLIIIAKKGDLLNRDTDLSAMLSLMKRFIFSNKTAEEYYDAISENTNGFTHPYLLADQDQFDYMNDVWEGRIEDEIYYDLLKTQLMESENYLNYYTKLVPALDDYRGRDSFKLLSFELTNPLDTGVYNGYYAGTDSGNGRYIFDGYNYFSVLPDGTIVKGDHYNEGYEYPQGRNQYFAPYTEVIKSLALAYQITRNEDYARLAYEMTISLCDWRHWTQGQMLNCATGAGELGFAYDWCYNVWKEMEGDYGKYTLDYIAQTIYEKAIFYGYIVAIDLHGQSNPNHSKIYYDDYSLQPGTTPYNDMEINWNAVCTAGLLSAALAIIGEEGNAIDYTYAKGKDLSVSSKHIEGCNILYYVLENHLQSTGRVMGKPAESMNSLTTVGLNQYAPDGSFIESPGYWGYATNNVIMLIWAIQTATGDDQGLLETWGLDKTCYYAVNIEYSNSNATCGYQYWNYHDSFPSYMVTEMFFYMASSYNDDALAAIRLQHLKNSKPMSLYDLLGYKPEYSQLSTDSIDLELEYYMEAMEAVVARDTWGKGSLFAGIMGEKNNGTAHGQIDSGNFYYANKNVEWFCDIGAENYDVPDLFVSNANVNYNKRHRYYRNNAEGANVVCITSAQSSMPFGQYWYGGGVITTLESGNQGMYTIMDNTTAYGGLATDARRGMLLTNNRQTLILQDEMSFSSPQDLVWIAHTQQGIEISADGKCATLYPRTVVSSYILQARLISTDENLKFEIMTAATTEEDFLLDATWRPDDPFLTSTAEIERTREIYKRLVVKAYGVTSFNVAVVIDVIKADSTANSKYTWTPMARWNVNKQYIDNTIQNTPQNPTDEEILLSELTMNSIMTNGNAAKKNLEAGYAFTTRTRDYFNLLCKVTMALEKHPYESFETRYKIVEGYNNYLHCLQIYNEVKERVNQETLMLKNLAKGLVGAKPTV